MSHFNEENNISVQGSILFSWENTNTGSTVQVSKVKPFINNEVTRVQSDTIKVFQHEETIHKVCGDEKVSYVLSNATDHYYRTIWKYTGNEKKELITTEQVTQFFMKNGIFYAVIKNDEDGAILIDDSNLTTIKGTFTNVKVYDHIYANLNGQIGVFKNGKFEILFKGLDIDVNPNDAFEENYKDTIHDYYIFGNQMILIFDIDIVYYNMQTFESVSSKMISTIEYDPIKSYYERSFHFYKDSLFILQDNLFTICNLVKKCRKTYIFPFTIHDCFCFEDSKFYFNYDDCIHVFNYCPFDPNVFMMAESKQQDCNVNNFFHHQTYHNVLFKGICDYIEKYPVDIDEFVIDGDVVNESDIEIAQEDSECEE